MTNRQHARLAAAAGKAFITLAPHMPYTDDGTAEDMRKAFLGDAGAAFSMCIFLDLPGRPMLVHLLDRHRSPLPSLRAALAETWLDDHHLLLQSFGVRRTLELLRRAQFPSPLNMPAMISVWRGTHNRDVEDARYGLSWTTNRDCAAWFAMRWASTSRWADPLVLRSDILTDAVIFSSNERNENEVVWIGPRSNAAIDGNHDDWREAYGRYAAKKMVALSIPVCSKALS